MLSTRLDCLFPERMQADIKLTPQSQTASIDVMIVFEITTQEIFYACVVKRMVFNDERDIEQRIALSGIFPVDKHRVLMTEHIADMQIMMAQTMMNGSCLNFSQQTLRFCCTVMIRFSGQFGIALNGGRKIDDRTDRGQRMQPPQLLRQVFQVGVVIQISSLPRSAGHKTSQHQTRPRVAVHEFRTELMRANMPQDVRLGGTTQTELLRQWRIQPEHEPFTLPGAQITPADQSGR